MPRRVNKPKSPTPESDQPAAAPFKLSQVNFKVRQLALLSALAETGTLRAAAERIHVSQPGATRLLKELEAMLGVPLFERTKGKMQVTSAGQMMMSHAVSLQNRMVNAYTDTRDASRGQSGSLRLGLFGSVDPGFLASCTAELLQRFEHLQLNIVEAPQNLLVGAVRRCELDAAIGRLIGSENEPDVRHQLLYMESFSVVCGAAHPLARRPQPPSAEDLVQAAWILPPRTTFLRQRIDAYFVATCGRVPTVRVESLSLLGCLSLLASTSNLCVLAGGVANFFAESGRLHVLVPNFGPIESPVALMTRADAPPRPAVEALLDIMKAVRPPAPSAGPRSGPVQA